MSVFCGYIDFGFRGPGRDVPEPFDHQLASTPGANHYAFPGGAVIQVDLNSFPEPGLHLDGAGASVLAGHPLLGDDTASRSSDGLRGLTELHLADHKELPDLLMRSHGVFAAANVLTGGDEPIVRLMCDRLGVRPIYWWQSASRLVFGSRITDVVRHPWVKRAPDYRGISETLALGYALRDRTNFLGVSRLEGGTILEIRPGRTHARKWYPSANYDGRPVEAQEMADAMRNAVSRRLTRGPEVAFLSGGLDSRVIAALLREGGCEVHTFNFAPEDSQDRVYARRFADLAGTRHTELVRDQPNPNWSILVSKAMDTVRSTGIDLKPPVWSGDGGSVCLGWVYVTPQIVSSLRDGQYRAAVDEFLGDHASEPPVGSMTAKGIAALGTRLSEEVSALVEEYAEDDPAKAFFRFLLDNDQRRHLERHFETLLEHRTEFWLPFFDGAVLDLALRVPTNQGIGHKHYMRWVECLPDLIRSTPWQTYPGHEPCPLPSDNLAYQWTPRSRKRRWRPNQALQLLRLIATGYVPWRFMRGGRVLGRVALQMAGLRRADNVVNWYYRLGSYLEEVGRS